MDFYTWDSYKYFLYYDTIIECNLIIYLQISSKESSDGIPADAPKSNAKKAMDLCRPRERLASTAAKKGLVTDKSRFALKTRQGNELQPDDPKMKTFSKSNFQAAKTDNQVKYQLQEMVSFVMNHLTNKLNKTTREKASLVSFLFKQFQKRKSNIYL